MFFEHANLRSERVERVEGWVIEIPPCEIVLSLRWLFTASQHRVSADAASMMEKSGTNWNIVLPAPIVDGEQRWGEFSEMRGQRRR